MSMHVALLRGINVGGHQQVPMSDLRDLFTRLGFTNVRSILQSGNVIFDSGRHSGPALEEMLTAETQKRFKLSIDYVVRTARDWETVLQLNPFPKQAQADPGHLLVMFLKTTTGSPKIESLRSAISGPEIIATQGKQLYVVYPAGIGPSKLTHRLIEQKLDARCTGRNWNTVVKLAAILHE